MEDNKLIAEFMGMKYAEERSWNKEDGWTHTLKSLNRFKSDWNWLMPVVEKISETEYDSQMGYKYEFRIDTPFVRVSDFYNNIYFSGNNAKDLKKPLIEKVYDTVVALVKHHNEHYSNIKT